MKIMKFIDEIQEKNFKRVEVIGTTHNKKLAEYYKKTYEYAGMFCGLSCVLVFGIIATILLGMLRPSIFLLYIPFLFVYIQYCRYEKKWVKLVKKAISENAQLINQKIKIKVASDEERA